MFRNFILSFLVLGVAVSIEAQSSQMKLRVEFEGNKIFSSDALLKKLNSCVAKHPDSESRYDARLFDYCLWKDVKEFILSQGYLNAKIGKSREQNGERSLNLSVPIEEGLRYRLGSISIQGAKVFTSEQLLQKLNLKTGDIADGQELYQWLDERVKKLYEDKGYNQSDFEVEPTFKPNPEKADEGTADLKIIVNEGSRFTIGRIKFVGNGQTSDRVLRSVLLIREDEIFSQQRFTESIEKLNGLGLFELIDEDGDVELKIDSEIPLINITIRVKKKILLK